MKEHWKNEPDEHDYPAAHDYLTLVTDEAVADNVLAHLHPQFSEAEDELTLGQLISKRVRYIHRCGQCIGAGEKGRNDQRWQ